MKFIKLYMFGMFHQEYESMTKETEALGIDWSAGSQYCTKDGKKYYFELEESGHERDSSGDRATLWEIEE